MLFYDGVSIPMSTLLVRRSEGAAATAVVDECFGPSSDPEGSVLDPAQDVAIWIGEVGPSARPLAVAVVRFGGVDAQAVVTAATVMVRANIEHLVARLVRGVVDEASASGCATLAAAEGGSGRPGPIGLLAAAGLTPMGARVWSIEQ